MPRGRSPAVLRQVSLADPAAAALVDELHADHVVRYGFADDVVPDPDWFVPPEGLFLVAYVDGVAAACGGCRTWDVTARIGEIKCLFVAPTFRGRGLARLLMADLEKHLVGAGLHEVVLETAIRQTEAMNLYTSLAYRPRASYVAGRDPALNRAFTKRLVPGSDGPGAGPYCSA